MGLMYTKHAIQRINKREITIEVIEFILTFGTSKHQKGGTEVIYIDKKSVREYKEVWRKKYTDNFISKALKASLVLNQEKLITAQYTTTRINSYL